MIVRTYENTVTGERHTEFLNVSDHEKYLVDHPEMKHVIGPLNVVDPVGIGVTKPDSAFLKHVIGRVKETTPGGSALEKRWHIPREW